VPLIIIALLLLFSSCASSEKVHDELFYHGLLISDNTHEKTKLFEKSLGSPNEFVRQASADELAVLISRGVVVSAEVKEKIKTESSALWSAAFEIAGDEIAGYEIAGYEIAGDQPGMDKDKNKSDKNKTSKSKNETAKTKPDKNKALNFLLSFEPNPVSSFDEPRSFVLRELQRQGIVFNEIETAVIEGRFSAMHSRYNDALNHFKRFQYEDKWIDKVPEIFVQYPNLINDLGRTFQYTQSGSEGLDLFVQWEKNLKNVSESDDLRYRLSFYAGRIARRIGAKAETQASALFEQALLLAPDYEQQDACIWYILDISMTGQINSIAEKIDRLVPLWHNGGYFNGIMERYLHRLVSSREWRRVVRTFNLIKDIDSSSVKSGYAWVIARAIQEGYLPVEAADVSAYMQVAYNAGDTFLMPALYYRMQSAAFLNLPFLNFNDEETCGCSGEEPSSDALLFLLGFFKNGAAQFSDRYIRALENKLNAHELRVLAQALDDAGLHPQSMRVVSLYINKENHCRHRCDLELMYPRPYLELIEKNAKMFNIAPSLLYGLIRTESAFQSAVVSRAGAVGLAQLMPGTARDQAERIRREGGPDFFGDENKVDSTDPDVNVYIGSYYYNYLFGRFNDNQLALMSYNGGQNRVRRWRNASNLPADLFVETVAIYETRDYGRRVPAIGKVYEELYYR